VVVPSRQVCYIDIVTMTTANKITILRILLIPFFVVAILYYVRTGNELHRLLAITTFAVAAICDGVTLPGVSTNEANWARFWIRWRTNCCWCPEWWC
jgi:hypothetical protein